VTATAVTAEKTGNDRYNGTRSPVKVIANFSVSPISGEAPLKVNFTDKSTGLPTSWKWSFGDGKSSYKQNPEHIYNKAGNYTVTLTVKKNKSTDTEVKKRYITVTKQKPVILPIANFSVAPNPVKESKPIKFIDKSTGSPYLWKWNFGDGTFSYQQNPKHKYDKEGTYTVSLKVTNKNGSNTKTTTVTVIKK
jgi:PKD repeat protein